MMPDSNAVAGLALCLALGLCACREEPRALKNESAPLVPAAAPSREPPGAAPPGMVWIPPGSFLMGRESNEPDRYYERPVHRVTLKGFWMDETEVTNAQFAEFAAATGHRTLAEKTPSREEFPGVPEEKLKPGANHFTGTTEPVETSGPGAEMQWWEYKIGANWRHPDGPESSIDGRGGHPVLCISWEDAVAYAKWAGKRLPTEAEWEYAARGGLQQQTYVWGGEFRPAGKWMANIWQGDFPWRDTKEDAFHGVAPVKSFPPNNFGLYDMSGNAWEWVNDWFSPDYYGKAPPENPPGPPPEPDEVHRNGVPCKVIRGGSWLCHDCYCKGYEPGARQWTTPDTSTNHTGFRCVKDAP